MHRVFILCLVLFSFMPEASARLLDEEQSRKLFLTDVLDVSSNRYGEGRSYSRFPGSERRLRIFPDLRRNPIDRIYARARTRVYTVQPDDTLLKIARRHTTTVELIKGLNRMKIDRVRSGQRILISDQIFSIEINKMFNRLYLKAGDVVVKEYPVSTGKSEAQTPLGIFLVQSRYPFPTWFHKGAVVSAASPDNYLGSRWLGFDKPQFGIHGTIFPELIGQSVSKGCIRMKNEDVEELYEFIPIATVVKITEM